MADTKRPESQEEEVAMMNVNMKRCWHIDLKLGPTGLVINPVVTAVSIVFLWTFVIVCMACPDIMLDAMNTAAFKWIPEVWTWLYIISQDIWIVVLFYVMVISKYGNLKLGKDTDEPEYTFATWFSMLFSAGVAVGLFYFSVAEPMWHYKGWGSPRFHSDKKGYGNNDEDALHAIMVTWYHWGLHGWIPYTTMGAVLAIMTYRRGFPMTIRYCLWPIIGDKCYGWMGDTIDILSIVTTIAGVCTSLGLGAMQLNAGFQRLNHGFFRGERFSVPSDSVYSDPTCGGTGQSCAPGKQPYGIQVNLEAQITIIVLVTCTATASVVSGLNNGIVNLSRFNFALGMFLLLCVLFLGETYFILDTLVEAFGYYLWYILKIGFYTDAFERLGSKAFGLGGAPDGNGGGSGWLSDWTIFYWGWWIAWGPFVGTFLAKISRGRTVRQFILGTLVVPTMYSFLWFGVFGAEGIRMQRMADGSGVCANGNFGAEFSNLLKHNKSIGWEPSCVLDPEYHGGFGRCKRAAWTRQVVVGDRCVESTSWVDEPCVASGSTGASGYSDPTKNTSTACAGQELDLSKFNKFPFSDAPGCFVPVQDSVVCLWNRGTNDIMFDQLSTYGPRGFSDFLSVITIAALILYFVTSSDSGSMVVDMISANGHHEPPIPQRIFWSFTEGATAIALLSAGKNLPNANGSLKALQSASMIAGLPYTFILFWCSQALYLLVKEETGELDPKRKAFSTFIISFGSPKELLKNTLLPGLSMGNTIRITGGWLLHQRNPMLAFGFWAAAFQILYLTAIIFTICSAALYQWCIVGLSLYLGFACFLGFLRTSFRSTFRIKHGDMLTDQLVSIFLPMFTITQMEVHIATGDTPGAEPEKPQEPSGQIGAAPIAEPGKEEGNGAPPAAYI